MQAAATGGLSTISIHGVDWQVTPSNIIGECPICADNMTSAIVCRSPEHAVCDECAPKIKTCPICRFEIEKLSSEDRCLHEMTLKRELANTTFFCRVPGCDWKGDHKDIAQHPLQHRIPRFADQYVLRYGGSNLGTLVIQPGNDSKSVLENNWRLTLHCRPPVPEDGKGKSEISLINHLAFLYHSDMFETEVCGHEGRAFTDTDTDTEEGISLFSVKQQGQWKDHDIKPEKKPVVGRRTGRSLEGEKISEDVDLSLVSERKNRYSQIALKIFRNHYNEPNMAQAFMFGRLHERMLADVCQSQKPSERTCFVQPLITSFKLPDNLRAYTVADCDHLDPVVDQAAGFVTKVIQKDPLACGGNECHMTISPDRQLWEKIEFIRPGEPSIVATRETLATASEAVKLS
ncbi:hypothetical protein M3P05_01685 [Sansalvadorimonas sp. 2012CJ34-2]|uniref:RING-type domain-containing protein n=1 Tax=Parendozoicomonas callyspongiae TaxID=2942213 RepID=A0ABT0PBD4_9GAMM|nr:RING-HC finger protein [Sansalvadorimonas sp. 2012CJ34-2]MCL6268664.1 hypothetical protein [Sansalvadorimonas sp. 2012CJ34-2]